MSVGAGGAGGLSQVNPYAGSPGGNTEFGGLTAIGGGRGSLLEATPAGHGGSGGGAGRNGTSAGLGTSGQGFNGGAHSGTLGSGGGAGGGGAKEAGTAASSANLNGSKGGDGRACDFSGSSVTYAGGGGGSSSVPGTGGAGGAGGGGAGDGTASNPGTAGTANTGGGGGGGGTRTSPEAPGGDGGSGIVIIRYRTDGSMGISPLSSGGTITRVGPYTIHTFTSTGSGTFTAVFS